ncbi:MAG: AAA family ATPase [Candidatus Peribacteraceae bacterium]|nr:AAA family ATPase [Candidatus Peribacteraceae bacterium]
MKLILVCGLPGAGKSTIARKIAEKTSSYVFNTDVIRKQLVDNPSYTEEEKEKVYNLLFEMTEKFLITAKNVVVDGTFHSNDLRKKIKEIATRTKSEFHLIEVVCSEKIVKDRMEIRKTRPSVSDADFEVHQKIKQKFEPIKQKHFVLKSGKAENEQVDDFLKTIN